ncbi:RRS1-domain-containing protein [Calocera viscosa TUFC12733]|uniref:Ribosome biogenesis regulatory protein n=1 Tax=Calocera viscosa (strain TUFC12733) TaxID=1330018 RepID=A0A167NVR0_CALVF|nr:RRS1-domain-containing protein [Calocera viscosa TUFC12733]
MDVSDLLQVGASKQKSIQVEKEIPLDIDIGYLTATDPNPINEDEYKNDREEYLQSIARDNAQLLINHLFSLPITSSPDGPLAKLPAPTTILPRAKPLPKPKPPTKWEKFASAKGIQKQRREKKIWDEEKQEFRDRWGRGGKNKELEEQWLVEVPTNADADHDPVKDARDAKRKRVAKNEAQQLKNIQRAERSNASADLPIPAKEREKRKTELDRDLAQTRVSTASMGKFDKKFEGEPKLRGVKRKFDPNEKSADAEKASALAILSKLDTSSRPSKRARAAEDGDNVLNVRKAIRHEKRTGGPPGRDSKARSGKDSKGRSRKGR